MTRLESRVINLETRVEGIESDFADHKTKFEARGKVHERNNQAMNDFAATYTKLSDLITKLFDKVTYLEKKEAVHDVIIDDFKNFSREMLVKMSAIEKTITANISRDTTLKWVGKSIIQLVLFAFTVAGTVIGIIKYFSEG